MKGPTAGLAYASSSSMFPGHALRTAAATGWRTDWRTRRPLPANPATMRGLTPSLSAIGLAIKLHGSSMLPEQSPARRGFLWSKHH